MHSTCQEELGRWLLSCPRGDGLLLARGNRIPIRIEATAEEKDVVEWRPGARSSQAQGPFGTDAAGS